MKRLEDFRVTDENTLAFDACQKEKERVRRCSRCNKKTLFRLLGQGQVLKIVGKSGGRKGHRLVEYRPRYFHLIYREYRCTECHSIDRQVIRKHRISKEEFRQKRQELPTIRSVR